MNGDDNLLMVNSFFYVMQWIGDRRVVGEYQPENVKEVLKRIHDKKESGLHVMFGWQEFERKWETYFRDRDHRNEAYLVSDGELARYLTLGPTILMDTAVKIMTLFLAIVRTGEESGNGVNAMMQEYKDLYGQTVENEGLVKSMMYYVAPTLVGRENIRLNQGVVDAHTTHFTQAVEFLYDLFMNHLSDDGVTPMYNFHLWLRSLYIYTNFVEVIKLVINGATEKQPVEMNMRTLMKLKGGSKSYMHRILTIEQLEDYIARRAETRAVDAQAGQKRPRGEPPASAGSKRALEDAAPPVQRRRGGGMQDSQAVDYEQHSQAVGGQDSQDQLAVRDLSGRLFRRVMGVHLLHGARWFQVYLCFWRQQPRRQKVL